jgi:hypothetical protein
MPVQQGMWDEARQWEAALGAAGELRARTVALYGQDVRRFLTWFAWYVTQHVEERRRRSGGGGPPSLDLDAVTSEEALAYRAFLLEQGRGRSCVNRALTSLRLFFAMRSDLSPSPSASDTSHAPNPFWDIPSVPRPAREA